MASEILVIGKELGNQLAQPMATERVRVLGVKDVGKARFYERGRAVVLDASIVPLDSETFQSVREQAKVPLLVISSTYEEAWLALQLGCDEVVVRPFDPEELKLRVRKMLGMVRSTRLLVGELLIDFRTREVRRREERLRLTPLEFELLAHLARNEGRVVGYDELLEKVWGYDYDRGTYLTIKTTIKRLRRKVEKDPTDPTYIVNVRQVGYMLKS